MQSDESSGEKADKEKQSTRRDRVMNNRDKVNQAYDLLNDVNMSECKRTHSKTPINAALPTCNRINCGIAGRKGYNSYHCRLCIAKEALSELLREDVLLDD